MFRKWTLFLLHTWQRRRSDHTSLQNTHASVSTGHTCHAGLQAQAHVLMLHVLDRHFQIALRFGLPAIVRDVQQGYDWSPGTVLRATAGRLAALREQGMHAQLQVRQQHQYCQFLLRGMLLFA